MRIRIVGLMLLCLVAMGAAFHPVHAAILTTYFDLSSFTAAAGGPLNSQDFEGYLDGANLSGVEFLPGVSATTNLPRLEAFTSLGDKVMFALDRAGFADVFYDFSLTLPYKSVAFEIDAFESIPGDPTTAWGPGQLTVFFDDATSQAFDISGNPTGAPIFIGLVADRAITGIRWAEAVEGTGGTHEETTFDNFRVGPAQAPEPGTMLLLGTGLAGLLGCTRRRRAA